MKLHTVNAARMIFHCVQCVVGQGRYLKSRWHFSNVIAVAHPNVELVWQILKQPARDVENFQARITKLAIRRRGDSAAELARENLKPVADAERWTIDRFEQLRMRFGRAVIVNGRRPAGKDQSF